MIKVKTNKKAPGSYRMTIVSDMSYGYSEYKCDIEKIENINGKDFWNIIKNGKAIETFNTKKECQVWAFQNRTIL